MVDGTAITHLSRGGHHYQSGGDHDDVIAQQSKDAIIYVTVSRNTTSHFKRAGPPQCLDLVKTIKVRVSCSCQLPGPLQVYID